MNIIKNIFIIIKINNKNNLIIKFLLKLFKLNYFKFNLIINLIYFDFKFYYIN